ncbi:MAG TPA: TIGR02710 family CRISPR-associated CARF protein [Chthonomonas sp.]|uniref:TIGR02710 family CRISPR-associated CARF protein n=1 Tax=Chthonomonas sp. TaxID=2282153 RepID=UPI002B4AB82B|nr:TIGR02710 family CRISPR-associated CARF protein [Chthonomonas sp.]HLI49019.1 TIGR02710 family CRISPR-associated CARF protein [Chthonomonas sp.]
MSTHHNETSRNSADKYNLLICTIGGSSEPIVASLKHWKPERVVFVPSAETEKYIEGIRSLAEQNDLRISPGQCDTIVLTDGQDFARCVEELRDLTPLVKDWLERGDRYQAVVDFTGGTKCMAAALALQARDWRCIFSYVGGAQRTSNGVGIVVSGKEQVLHTSNPWDALGFQTTERFAVLFDQHAFAAAAEVAKVARNNTSSPSLKRELNALCQLAEAYDAWDRFDHKQALSKLQEAMRAINDLAAALPSLRSHTLERLFDSHYQILQQLASDPLPDQQHIKDLVSNAKRRKEEGRLDDAVARLYRAVEALAQLALKERHQIPNTKAVPLSSIPEPLRSEWVNRTREGKVMLGLRDAYALLDVLGDELGAKFKSLKLDGDETPLTARNESILAHGFTRVSEEVYWQLWTATLQLAELDEEAFITFPKLQPTH